MNEERRNIYSSDLVKHPRLLTGGWFAVTGAIPGFVFLLVIGVFRYGLNTRITLMWLATIIMAGSYGAGFGRGILDPLSVWTGAQAVWWGCLVAILSYITFVLLISLIAGIEKGLVDFISALIGFLTLGTLFIGMPLALIGGLAGWLLFKRYCCRVVVTT